jgi:hypothetical protein
MKRLLMIAACISLGACTQGDRATQALADAGYTNIQISGYAWFSCSEKDTFATAFEARGPSGRPVSGAVCSGFLKGQTIRLD